MLLRILFLFSSCSSGIIFPEKFILLDFLIVFEKDNYKISCLTELKGTSGKKEVEHAYEQIRMTIDEVRNDYLQNSKMSANTLFF